MLTVHFVQSSLLLLGKTGNSERMTHPRAGLLRIKRTSIIPVEHQTNVLTEWIISEQHIDVNLCVCVLSGKWEVEEMKDTKLPGDKGLVLKSRAKHHAISALLLRPFTFDTKPLIVQWVCLYTRTHARIWTDLSSVFVPSSMFSVIIAVFHTNCSWTVACWLSGMRWTFRMESTVAVPTSNYSPRLQISTW